jgi:hypothetical protein
MAGASVVPSAIGARRELTSRGVRGAVGSEFGHTRHRASILAPLLVLGRVGTDARSSRWLGTSPASSRVLRVGLWHTVPSKGGHLVPVLGHLQNGRRMK